jgi:hypothetical protein
VPDYAEFVLFRIAFLPVLVGHSKACVRVGSDPYLAAVSMDGQFFYYDGQDCITDMSSVVCSVERVTPKTCAEKLAVGDFKMLPTICTTGLTLGFCERQEYIFSPFNDTVILECVGKMSWLPMQAGTAVYWSAHCLTSTYDLLIPGVGGVKKPILVSGALTGFEETLLDLDTVLDNILVSHAISLSNQTTFL